MAGSHNNFSIIQNFIFFINEESKSIACALCFFGRRDCCASSFSLRIHRVDTAFCLVDQCAVDRRTKRASSTFRLVGRNCTRAVLIADRLVAFGMERVDWRLAQFDFAPNTSSAPVCERVDLEPTVGAAFHNLQFRTHTSLIAAPASDPSRSSQFAQATSERLDLGVAFVTLGIVEPKRIIADGGSELGSIRRIRTTKSAQVKVVLLSTMIVQFEFCLSFVFVIVCLILCESSERIVL